MCWNTGRTMHCWGKQNSRPLSSKACLCYASRILYFHRKYIYIDTKSVLFQSLHPRAERSKLQVSTEEVWGEEPWSDCEGHAGESPIMHCGKEGKYRLTVTANVSHCLLNVPQCLSLTQQSLPHFRSYLYTYFCTDFLLLSHSFQSLPHSLL